MNRRYFICRMLTAVTATSLSGCITYGLFEPEEYDEHVSSLLISKDGKYFVVMTKQYHYVFAAPPAIVASVKSSYHAAISASFSGFNVDAAGKTTGRVVLFLSRPSQEILQAAIKDGYTANEYGVEFDTLLTGQRYLAGDVFPTEQYQLNETHTIHVTAEQSKIKKAGKLLVSPVTVAVDGVLFVFGAPVILLMLVTAGPPLH